jgi:hypothetical protein
MKIIMRIISTIILFLLPLFSFGQFKTKELRAGSFILQATTVDSALNDLFYSCGEMPTYPGGINKLEKYATKFLYYPKTAINDSIEGRVLLKFMIDTTGKACDEIIVEGIRVDLDSICLSMIRHMPLWEPASISLERVEVWFYWPIRFQLIEEKKATTRKEKI